MVMFSPGGSILTLLAGMLKIYSSAEEWTAASYAGLVKVIRGTSRCQ